MRAKDLAEEVGCTGRQLRTLIQAGLVRPAHGRGRAASYSDVHVKQARWVLAELMRTGTTQAQLSHILDIESANKLRRDAMALYRLADQLPRLGGTASLSIGLVVQVSAGVPKREKPTQRQVLLNFAAVLRDEAQRIHALRGELLDPNRTRPGAT